MEAKKDNWQNTGENFEAQESAKSPEISVIMPAFNSEKYIEEAIRSVLNQSFKNFELVIVDDASTDGTWKIVQKMVEIDSRIVPIKKSQNDGPSSAGNLAVSKSRGKYIARQDSDDFSFPDRLARQLDFMEKNPEVAVCGSAIEVCGENLSVISKRNYPADDFSAREKIFRYSPFCHSAVMFRKNIFLEARGYDEKMREAEDYDLYFRMGRFGKFANLSEVLVKLRTRPDSLTSKNVRRMEKLTLKTRLKAVKKYGYKMSVFDKIYFALQYAGIFILPNSIKFKLFNFFRNSDR